MNRVPTAHQHPMANNVTPLISIGQLVDQSWETYRDHFKPLMRIASWFFLPALLLVLSKIIIPLDTVVTTTGAASMTSMEAARAIIGGGIGVLTSWVVMPLVGAWIFLATAKLLKAIHEQKQGVLDEKQISQSAKQIFFRYILQAILLFCIIILIPSPMIPGFALITINAFVQGGRLLGMFSIVLMILGTLVSIYFALRFAVTLAFSGFELAVDNKKAWQGIKASHALVKGHYFGTLWRMIVPALVFGVIPFVIETGAVVLFSLLVASMPNTNDALLINIISLFGTLIVMGVNALVTPLPIAANYFLYESLKRSQGNGNA